MPLHGMAKDRPGGHFRALLASEPTTGQRGTAPLLAGGPRGPFPPRRVRDCAPPSGLGVARRRPEAMGPFGVLDIEVPEVKFLDHRGIGRGGGVPLVRVRRSRTRVWGAKMIRYHRSLPR